MNKDEVTMDFCPKYHIEAESIDKPKISIGSIGNSVVEVSSSDTPL